MGKHLNGPAGPWVLLDGRRLRQRNMDLLCIVKQNKIDVPYAAQGWGWYGDWKRVLCVGVWMRGMKAGWLRPGGPGRKYLRPQDSHYLTVPWEMLAGAANPA